MYKPEILGNKNNGIVEVYIMIAHQISHLGGDHSCLATNQSLHQMRMLRCLKKYGVKDLDCEDQEELSHRFQEQYFGLLAISRMSSYRLMIVQGARNPDPSQIGAAYGDVFARKMSMVQMVAEFYQAQDQLIRRSISPEKLKGAESSRTCDAMDDWHTIIRTNGEGGNSGVPLCHPVNGVAIRLVCSQSVDPLHWILVYTPAAGGGYCHFPDDPPLEPIPRNGSHF